MPLWVSAFLFVLCVAGGIYTFKAWRIKRGLVHILLCVALFLASAVFLLYVLLTFVFLNAI